MNYREDEMSIADIIYNQFGGGRAMAMIGGKVVTGEKHIAVHFKGCRKTNIVTITLDEAMDLYRMTFYRLCGVALKEVKKFDSVYAEDMKEIFESETGLYLSL